MPGLRDLFSGALAGGTGAPDITQLLESLRRQPGMGNALSLVPAGRPNPMAGGGGRMDQPGGDLSPYKRPGPFNPTTLPPEYSGRADRPGGGGGGGTQGPLDQGRGDQPGGGGVIPFDPLPIPDLPDPTETTPVAPPVATTPATTPAETAAPAGPTPEEQLAERLMDLFGLTPERARRLAKHPEYQKYADAEATWARPWDRPQQAQTAAPQPAAAPQRRATLNLATTPTQPAPAGPTQPAAPTQPRTPTQPVTPRTPTEPVRNISSPAPSPITPTQPAAPAQPVGPTPAERLAQMFGLRPERAKALATLPEYQKYLQQTP